MNYYKYTTGNAFTLNNSDYTGFFHINDDLVPYTGKTDSPDMQLLTYKKTFMSSFYEYKENFNNSYSSIDNIEDYIINNFDAFNKEGINYILNTLDNNNIICFKGLTMLNPTVYNIDNKDLYYIAKPFATSPLSALDRSAIVAPLSVTDEFAFLNNVISSDFEVNSRNRFNYYCSTGSRLYTLNGSFLEKEVFTKEYEDIIFDPYSDKDPDYLYTVYSDEDDKKLYYVKTEKIEIYDSSNFSLCNKNNLFNLIQLKPVEFTKLKWGDIQTSFSQNKVFYNTQFLINNPNNPQYIKFGRNLRTHIDNNNNLFLYNKTSSVLYNVLSLSSYGVQDVLSIDIRNTDDYIGILYSALSSGQIGLLFLDPKFTEISQNPNKFSVMDLKNYVLKYDTIFSLDSYPKEYVLNRDTVVNSLNYKLTFSNLDSDVFYIDTPVETQTRSISVPVFPVGRTKFSDVLYPKKYTFGNYNSSFGNFASQWDYFDTKENTYNKISRCETIKNSNIYSILHNNSRVYISKNYVNDYLYNLISLDVPKSFYGVSCSESTLGLYLNNEISKIVKDLLTLYSNAYGSFYIGTNDIAVTQLEQLLSITNDIYLNGNETINTISLQRILVLINNLQSTLIAKINYNDFDALLPSRSINNKDSLSGSPVTTDLLSAYKNISLGNYGDPPLLNVPYNSNTVYGPPNEKWPNNQTAPRKLRVMINAVAKGPNGDNDVYDFSYYNCVEYDKNVGGWVLYDGTDPRMLAFGRSKKDLGIEGEGSAVILKWNPNSTVPLYGKQTSYNPSVNGMWELTNGATPSTWTPPWTYDTDADIYSLVTPTPWYLQSPIIGFNLNESGTFMPTDNSNNISYTPYEYNDNLDYRPPFKSLNKRSMEVNPNGLKFVATFQTSNADEAINFTNSLKPNSPYTEDLNKKLVFNKLGYGVSLNDNFPKKYGYLNEMISFFGDDSPEMRVFRKRIYTSLGAFKQKYAESLPSNSLSDVNIYPQGSPNYNKIFSEDSTTPYGLYYEIRVDLINNYPNKMNYPLDNYDRTFIVYSPKNIKEKYSILNQYLYNNFDCGSAPYYLSKENRLIKVDQAYSVIKDEEIRYYNNRQKLLESRIISQNKITTDFVSAIQKRQQQIDAYLGKINNPTIIMPPGTFVDEGKKTYQYVDGQRYIASGLDAYIARERKKAGRIAAQDNKSRIESLKAEIQQISNIQKSYEEVIKVNNDPSSDLVKKFLAKVNLEYPRLYSELFRFTIINTNAFSINKNTINSQINNLL